MLVCANRLKKGLIPNICFSSWNCSAAYQPLFLKEGKEEHDYLISEIERIHTMMVINRVQSKSVTVEKILGLVALMIGVSFILSEAEIPTDVENLNVQGGQRVESSTAILQATCVDATLIKNALGMLK
jgi:hypothetical protein